MENKKKFETKNEFFPRLTEEKGLWMFFLLPSSIILSTLKHPVTVTLTYKFATATAIMLSFTSIYIIAKCWQHQKIKVLNMKVLMISLLTCLIIRFWLNKDWWFSVISGLLSTTLFIFFYKCLLRNAKKSFTFGEAGLTAQGLTLFLLSYFYSIIEMIQREIKLSNMQKSTVIIQVGILGIAAFAYILNKTRVNNHYSFYYSALFLLTSTVIVPLFLILKENPLIWIFSQVLEDVTLLKLFIYWSACIAIAVLAVNNQIYYAKKASTSTRKIFHILAVLVYIPGLYYRCCFLYLASGVTLGFFFFLEILRLLCIPPLGKLLQDGYEVFRDEKDTGPLALTPIYLLVGVSLPIWLHPSPCDITDSTQFTILPLLSGLVTIGIGDTAASYVGSRIGRIKWESSSKTIEGTLACIISQVVFFLFIYYIGLLTQVTTVVIVKIVLSITITSIVEAKTSQIDNLVLPLIMYIILV
ncbi:dolichol kinase [Euwallacea similis]|uniref:dolichol kinase n=1 Tax=Euwallacea similis TaxID=1736056 RepID=UPI00344DEE4B